MASTKMLRSVVSSILKTTRKGQDSGLIFSSTFSFVFVLVYCFSSALPFLLQCNDYLRFRKGIYSRLLLLRALFIEFTAHMLLDSSHFRVRVLLFISFVFVASNKIKRNKDNIFTVNYLKQ